MLQSSTEKLHNVFLLCITDCDVCECTLYLSFYWCSFRMKSMRFAFHLMIFRLLCWNYWLFNAVIAIMVLLIQAHFRKSNLLRSFVINLMLGILYVEWIEVTFGHIFYFTSWPTVMQMQRISIFNSSIILCVCMILNVWCLLLIEL